MSEYMKKFTPFDKDINLVHKPNDLDEYDDDPGVLRAVLSCGHVTDPETLTDCCRAQMDDGRTEFRCPLCRKEWPYDEVRKLAKLTIEEQLSFEDMLGTNTAMNLVDIRECPGCGSLIERMNVSSLCVECSVCTARNRKTFEFCWQCVREWKGPHTLPAVWKGPQPRADRCGNVGCRSADQELLRDCPMITLKSVNNVQCPAIRACPSCGVLIEHSSEESKTILCHKCNNEFCFLCLKSARECLKTSAHFKSCSAGVAPRQINSVN